MAVIKEINDSIRVRILDAMTKKGCVIPNVRQIKKVTGFHRSTIKSSIDFLENQNFVTGYRPLLDPTLAGYKLASTTYLQINPSQKKNYNQLIDVVKKDNSVINFSEVVTDSNFNITLSFISKNIEAYHNNIREKYMLGIFNYYDFVKKSSSFYLSAPFYKRKNEVDVIIDLLKEEKAID